MQIDGDVMVYSRRLPASNLDNKSGSVEHAFAAACFASRLVVLSF